MKKIIALFVAVTTIVCLSACGSEKVTFKVIAPNGSPALSQTYLQKTNPSLGKNVTYTTDIVNGTDPLIAAFNGTYDIIFAPSNMGVKLYNAKGEYQLLGTVVWGNLYFATVTDKEFTLNDLKDKDIILFGENTVPGIVANNIIDGLNCKVSYLTSTAETQAEIIKDNSKIVLIAEPSLSAMKVKLTQAGITNVKTINLTSEWQTKTGLDGFPQACAFVKKDFALKHHDLVVAYMDALKVSCDKANSDTDNVSQMAVDLEYGFPLPVLKGSLKNSNIKFSSASESKKALEDFLDKIISSGNGQMVGGKKPDSSFYFN